MSTAPFVLPELYINPAFSWGPPAEEMTLNGEPFQLYRKPDRSDRVDRSCLPVFDFVGAMRAAAEATDSTQQKRKFEGVEDTRRQQALEIERKKSMASRIRSNYHYNTNNNANAKNNAKKNRYYRSTNANSAPLPNTISIPSSATTIAEYTLAQISKLPEVVPLVEEIDKYCLPRLYKKDIESASLDTPVILSGAGYDRDLYRRPDLFDDSVLRSLVSKEDVTVPLIAITDELLSLLLTAHRSIHPWHMKVAHTQKCFMLSRSDLGGRSRQDNVEKQWVGETATQDVAPSEGNPVVEERISSLGEESTMVHETFISACCSKRKATLKSPTKPLKFDYNTQPRLYRYRRFRMNRNTPDEYNILVRCEVDAVTEDEEYLRAFGLLEQEVKDKENWVTKIQNGKGSSILPDAFQANSAKISRWIALSLLSEVSQMKIGLITRNPTPPSFASDKDDKKEGKTHRVIKVVSIPPANLVRQLNVNYNAMWATANLILLTLIRGSKAPFGLVVKNNTRMLTIADNCDESDNDDDDDDDDEEDEEDEEEESDEEQ